MASRPQPFLSGASSPAAAAEPVDGEAADRFWVLGERWTEDATRWPWPRVYGPYYDYPTACASALELNGLDGAVSYAVLALGPETPLEPRRARARQI